MKNFINCLFWVVLFQIIRIGDFFVSLIRSFLSATVVTILTTVVISGAVVLLTTIGILYKMPEPHPQLLWIWLVASAPIFIFSTVALLKKKKKDWRPKNLITY